MITPKNHIMGSPTRIFGIYIYVVPDMPKGCLRPGRAFCAAGGADGHKPARHQGRGAL